MNTINQQINLYQLSFRKQKISFSAYTLLTILVALGLGMSVIYGYSIWQGQQLDNELTALKARHTKVQSELEKMKQKYPARTSSLTLEQYIVELELSYRTKISVFNTLREQVARSGKGFAKYFEGLARQTVPGLWITSIRLNAGGAYLGMSGSTMRPEFVPKLLQALATEKAYLGTEFKVLTLERTQQGADWIDFQLVTKNIGDD